MENLQVTESHLKDSQDESSKIIKSCKRKLVELSVRRNRDRKQFSSFLLFFSVIIFVNLCPFYSDQNLNEDKNINVKMIAERATYYTQNVNYLNYVDDCFKFVKLMFTNPLARGERSVRYTLAQAKVLGKMAKVWYIKKKIKKLGKKLKKHTIAVPVLTAIPIYEPPYYPQPHHMPHHQAALHHAAAASVFVPTFAQVTQTPNPIASTSSNNQQTTLATAEASNSPSYRVPPHHQPLQHHPAMYHPMPAASAHHIINSYPPSPPLYVDDTGALYGTYGNAYGRYDGGYQYW